MDRARKEELVTELSQSFAEAALVVVTQQTGLTVSESTELRSRMREAGAGYKVTKNRLAKLALAGTTYEQISDLFSGPTAIAYSADPVAAARVAVSYAKENDKLIVVGGAMGDTLLDENAVKALASLPSLDELRSKLVGLLNAPATKVAGVLQAPAGQLARVFGAYANQDEAA
ncbi:MAG: 50S ribosomal protein L10 [Rhodospirillaceae bacterium]|nr:50S ribosomal protein L10 [Rhodospirillaceae bacterium]MBT5358830.1 50S ribosomal protein L10 [Rhodospirillaceae bacterium]MBT5769599.1 50S ribosomal protein L10 [Rhodospirillaceae bacterium]MBT6308445.1 50S ribosomal protein L10 [Rhodospirillaceae bacterium]MBT7365078.1 50S ribosomal protein L10 [Rhodospirillaceae bacterium]